MTQKAHKKPIIIKKVKKGGHGGHHGGSWKVAYADFVTAMMAFFMVMWILGMDESTKQAVEGYFSNPVGYKRGYGSGNSPIANGNSPQKITQAQVKFFMHVAEERALNEAGERVKMKLNGARGVLGSGRFEVDVTQEGLRIELIESAAQDQFFTSGSAELRPMGTAALELIAIELGALRNPVILEGHTDAKPFGSDRGYTNWELSADRANAARRALAEAGLDPARLKEVRGYADTRLRVPNDRFAPQNRRITIFLPFNTSPPEQPTVTAAPTAPAN